MWKRTTAPRCPSSLANNPDGANLGGTLSVTANNGVATFAGLTLDQLGTGYTLAVSSNGLSGATSNGIDVIPVPAQLLVITQQPPASIIAGDSFGLIIQAEDNADALASTFNGTVTVALANNPNRGDARRHALRDGQPGRGHLLRPDSDKSRLRLHACCHQQRRQQRDHECHHHYSSDGQPVGDRHAAVIDGDGRAGVWRSARD